VIPNRRVFSNLHTEAHAAMLVYMSKKKPVDSHIVNTRLSQAEIDKLEQAAKSQSVPVSRAQLMAHIIREWLKQQEKRER
jgi:hypothetical protein